jgi:prepilin-type N-terminal cleavage/methylation domain-containing protein
MTPPRQNPGRPRGRRGATLVELMASMAILSVLVMVLGAMLSSALGRFRSGAETTGQRGGARVAADWLQRDLAAHLSSRPAAVPRLPQQVGENPRQLLEGRLLLPFEIGRRSGTGAAAGRSFANAAPEFGSIAFATRAPDRDGDPAAGAPAIVGYYVAYARHSPLAGEAGAGMKLFRHYRPGGHPFAAGYADAALRQVAREINDDPASAGADPRALPEENRAALRLGRFANEQLPFLLSRRETADGSPAPVPQAWPARPVRELLHSPPPDFRPARGTEDDWADPASAVHDSLFPDEPICDHVVRFELTAWRRVELPGGGSELMDAAALNRHLGLDGGDEWPVLVAPDYLDLVIAVVPETLARRLQRPEDWIVDWSGGSAGGSDGGSTLRQRIVEESRTYRFRLALPPRSA